MLVDRPAPGLSADLVEIDDYRAAFEAVAHLAAHGHRRIAYVGDTPAIPTSAARLRGYRDALAQHRIETDEHLVNCDVRDQPGRRRRGVRPCSAVPGRRPRS